MILHAVVHGQGEQVLEGGDVVSQEDTVIGLAYGGNIKIMEGTPRPES